MLLLVNRRLVVVATCLVALACGERRAEIHAMHVSAKDVTILVRSARMTRNFGQHGETARDHELSYVRVPFVDGGTTELCEVEV